VFWIRAKICASHFGITMSPSGMDWGKSGADIPGRAQDIQGNGLGLRLT
jgi:hypothetical protein